MSLKYYLPERGEEPAHARDLLSGRGAPKSQSSHPETFAEEAAQYCHSNRDGWEWDWPNVFVIVDGEKEVGRFSVDIKMEPQFYATKVEPV